MARHHGLAGPPRRPYRTGGHRTEHAVLHRPPAHHLHRQNSLRGTHSVADRGPTPCATDTGGARGPWDLDIQDDLDDLIAGGEIVTIVSGDRFFTKPLPGKEIRVTVNRRAVLIRGGRQSGASIKDFAIAQGVPIQTDFLLSRKDGPKFKPVGDDELIHVRNDDEFRANDGDDNS